MNKLWNQRRSILHIQIQCIILFNNSAVQEHFVVQTKKFMQNKVINLLIVHKQYI